VIFYDIAGTGSPLAHVFPALFAVSSISLLVTEEAFLQLDAIFPIPLLPKVIIPIHESVTNAYKISSDTRICSACRFHRSQQPRLYRPHRNSGMFEKIQSLIGFSSLPSHH
jgi:hypothetical protein